MHILNSNSYDKTSPIGFFDSGVGGLTVLNKVRQILPNEDIIYYGDTKNMPYGEKDKSQLLAISDNIFKYFEQRNCKAVVMACNTTSSVIYEDVKTKYNYKIYPIVQSVAKILSELDIERLGILATRATINSRAYEKEISKYNSNMKVFGHFCPSWVHIVESHSQNDEANVLSINADLEEILKYSPEKIVLGCTHYPFLLDVLTKLTGNRDMFIDPATSFADFIKQDLKLNNLLNEKTTEACEEFIVSSNPEEFKKSSKMFYDIKTLPDLLTF